MSLYLNVDVERLKLSELNSVGGKEQYEVKILRQVHSPGKLRLNREISTFCESIR
jgi:hypothetical protein